MPQVPYSGAPSVAPQMDATPGIRVNAPAEAFGMATARANANLGGALERSGDELFKRALALQELDQQAEASNAYSEFVKTQGVEYANYQASQGKEAVDGYSPYLEAMEKRRNEAKARLSSEYAQRLFDSQSRSFVSYNTTSAANHMAQQNKNYLIGSEQGGVETARLTSGMNPDNEDAYKAALSKIDNSPMDAYHGWSPEQKADWVLKEKSKVVAERAEALANRGDVAGAKRVLDAATKSGIITSDAAGQVDQRIRSVRNGVVTRNEGAKLLDGDGGHFGTGKVSPSRLREAISSVESSGNYNPPHPNVTHKVNGQIITEHALGRYGIMQSNLQPWLKEAGMPAMSEKEFLADHAAQDKLAEFKLAQYQEKYGSANKAAMVWFTGSANPNPNASDGGTTAAGYLKKFNIGLGKSAGTQEVREIADKRAREIEPNDAEFHERFTDHVTVEHAKSIATEKAIQQDNKNLVYDAIAAAPDGKLPTSISDHPDPKVREAWEALSPTDQRVVNNILMKNATQVYAPTPENQAEFRRWVGQMADSEMTNEEREAIQDANFLEMKLPWTQRVQLQNMRKKVFSGPQNPVMTHAMSVAMPILKDPDLGLEKEDINLFRGALHEVLQSKMDAGEKIPKDQELQDIVHWMLRKQYTDKGIFGSGIWRGEDKAFNVMPDEPLKQKIVAAYTERYGQEPTDQQIKIQYNALQFKALYGKKQQKVSAK